MPIKNLAGQRIGRFHVLEFAGLDRQGCAQWKCRCDCGTVKIVRSRCFYRGHTQSCGCYKLEVNKLQAKAMGPTTYQHGHGYGTPEYHSWLAMKSRCLNPKTLGYANYGGRGISICDSWSQSFSSFLSDMGPRPTGRTLDRINVNGNYEPTNCRWATPKEQYQNTRKKTAERESLGVR